MAQPDEMNNWRQFQGTELGALMSKLYSGSNKPVVNYPKPKTKSFQPTGDFRPVGNKADSRDPRLSTKRDIKVAVPKLANNKHDMDLAPVQLIPRRKNEITINKEIDDIRMRQASYRPAYVQPISSDMEKGRLGEIFAYKGGKCLPDELTNPVGMAPFELRERQRDIDINEKFRISRGLKPANSTVFRSKVSSHAEQMVDQITKEIDERVEYVESMRGLGALSKSDENRLRGEIKNRVDELNSLKL